MKKQRLTPSTRGKSRDDIVNVINSLCGVQYDPLPVIAQAQYITLWNRIQGFRQDWLDSLLYKERKLIEFMLIRQTLNIAATEELPYYFQGTRSVAGAGWIQRAIDKREDETSKRILKIMRESGKLSPKDFNYAAFRPLFYSGRIFIVERAEGTFRMPYYHLLSDHFPDLNLESIDEKTARQWLVMKALSAYGVSPSRHIAYWIGYKVKETEEILRETERQGVITQVKVEGIREPNWISFQDLNALKAYARKESFVALLTLIDNLVRDRKWLEKLFNYSFEVEYFQKKGMKWHVNILHDDEFLGFIDPKIDRPRSHFIIKDIVLNRELNDDEWSEVLARIRQLAEFHKAERVRVTRTENPEIQKALRKYGFYEEKKGELNLDLN